MVARIGDPVAPHHAHPRRCKHSGIYKLKGANPNGAAAIKHLGNQEAANGARVKASIFAKQVAPVLASIQETGHTTTRAIARELNLRTVPTARGGQWTAQNVINIMGRL